jgi:hypothetical protein
MVIGIHTLVQLPEGERHADVLLNGIFQKLHQV